MPLSVMFFSSHVFHLHPFQRVETAWKFGPQGYDACNTCLIDAAAVDIKTSAMHRYEMGM